VIIELIFKKANHLAMTGFLDEKTKFIIHGIEADLKNPTRGPESPGAGQALNQSRF